MSRRGRRSGKTNGVTPLFDELLKIYCRYSAELDNSDYYDQEKQFPLDKLGDAIIRIVSPKTVGDVITLPHSSLRNEGLIYLIKKDASDAYDQVDGFIEMVIMEEIEAMITPAQHGLDGLKLCEWIDQEFPVTPGAPER